MSITDNIPTRVILSIFLGLELVAFLTITHLVYNGVINTTIYVVIIVTVIDFNIYLWTKIKQRGWVNRFVIIQILLLIAFPMLFWLYKPHYTFLQAKSEVIRHAEFLNGFKVQDKRYVNLRMLNSPNLFIRSAYLLKVSNENGTEKYIIFDPISGKYKFFE